jgi:hypothetical protein
MDDNNDPRTGLAEKVLKWLALGIPLLTATIDLISKVVNYGGPVREFRILLQARR